MRTAAARIQDDELEKGESGGDSRVHGYDAHRLKTEHRECYEGEAFVPRLANSRGVGSSSAAHRTLEQRDADNAAGPNRRWETD